MILKLVNPTAEPIEVHIDLAWADGVASKAQLISLSGEKGAKNSFDRPERVGLVKSTISAVLSSRTRSRRWPLRSFA